MEFRKDIATLGSNRKSEKSSTMSEAEAVQDDTGGCLERAMNGDHHSTYQVEFQAAHMRASTFPVTSQMEQFGLCLRHK